MGKHRKIINDDPILKKDYKYEKRKKQRAQQRQKMRQIQQKRKQAEMELQQIRYEVDRQIEQQLQHKLHKYTKTKTIVKLPHNFLKNKVSEEQKHTNHHKNINSTKTALYLKSVILDQNIHNQLYYDHFYTPNIQQLVTIRRQNRTINKKQQIDHQIRTSIKKIFETKQQNTDNKNQPQQQQFIDDNNDNLQKQISYKDAYILNKQQIKEKQYLIKSVHQNQQNQQLQYGSFLVTTNCTVSDIPINQQQNVYQSIIHSYHDYVHIEGKQQSTIDQFRQTVLAHIINHENIVSKPTFTLKSSQEINNQQSKGFTNARNLILTPYYGDARTIIEKLQQKYFQQFQSINKQKVYGEQLDDQNDFFRIGIKINWKKKTIKYFANFNNSNVIIASPVGLKAIIGAEGDKNRDCSFLSSVQILYIDRASTILMQNWDHLTQVLKSINQMPDHQAICNSIDQLRTYVPQLKSKLYRQSIVFSEFNFAELNSIKYQYFHNWQGCLTQKLFYSYHPLLSETSLQKHFYKFEIKQPSHDLDGRFNFFKNKFWDQLQCSQGLTKTVIITRTYFQYIKLKDFFNRANASAECICQFTKKSRVQSYISQFNANKFRILLLTERAYYFDICRIKKFQHLYFYSLPYNEFIFTQLMNQLVQVQKQRTHRKIKSIILYNKYDSMILQRMVGSKKSSEMLKQFCSNVSFIL